MSLAVAVMQNVDLIRTQRLPAAMMRGLKTFASLEQA
jgi:hypothetical protein